MDTTAIVTEVGLLLVPATTPEQYADAYRAARREFHQSTTMADGWAAQDKAARIVHLAEWAGIYLDEITLDEEARVASLEPGRPLLEVLAEHVAQVQAARA